MLADGATRVPLTAALPATASHLKTPVAQPEILASHATHTSQILAAASDCSVRAWCAATGAPRATLTPHARPVHIVEAHPTDARLALSAGYDGRTVVWDVREGRVLKT